ncbi:hypothetical protein NL676_006627 [Syzygium grande]|nr:hypothetical protein NL676_006627 [Syzygium grande]
MEGDIFSGISNGTPIDAKMLQMFQKSFLHVQGILDQNRLLINEINLNQESKIPDNLSRNVDHVPTFQFPPQSLTVSIPILSSSFLLSPSSSFNHGLAPVVALSVGLSLRWLTMNRESEGPCAEGVGDIRRRIRRRSKSTDEAACSARRHPPADGKSSTFSTRAHASGPRNNFSFASAALPKALLTTPKQSATDGRDDSSSRRFGSLDPSSSHPKLVGDEEEPFVDLAARTAKEEEEEEEAKKGSRRISRQIPFPCRSSLATDPVATGGVSFLPYLTLPHLRSPVAGSSSVGRRSGAGPSHVAGAEGVDEAMFEDGGVGKISPSISPTKQISDPVVYKLVRVEGDGRLVPATDDEIMEVVDLLKDDTNEMHIVPEPGQAMGISIEDSSSGKSLSEISGFSKLEDVYADAENLEAPIQETAAPVAPSPDIDQMKQSVDAAECSNSPDQIRESESSCAATSLVPDFSKLEGKICLDNLSIRELHETFRATFGRVTTVKDKTWLKRRIAMGLIHSCDIPSTSFVIKDNQILKLGEEEKSDNVNCAVATDQDVVAINDQHTDLDISQKKQLEDCQLSGKRLRNCGSIEDSQPEVISQEQKTVKRLRNCGSIEDSQPEVLSQEQKTVKRLRKPTRRYIEEVSEVEHHEQLMSQGWILLPVYESHVFLGSEEAVPVDIMALVGFYHSSGGLSGKLLSKTLGTSSDPKKIQHQGVQLVEKDNQCMAIDRVEPEQNLEAKHGDSSDDASKDNIVTVPTAKGGIRRKHHRAWTLAEVMRLVEGVSRYGAGRWSEIKRLAFASYSYRTSVDLKDKWRNLLKASFAPAPADKAMNPRKHVSAPIPAQILLRVRELAELHAQASPNLSTSNSLHPLASKNPEAVRALEIV